MDANGDSLAWVFGLRPPKGSDKRLDAAAVEAVTKAVVAAATAAGPAAALGAPTAFAKAVSCVADAMETRLSEVVVSAWNKRKEITRYADLSKYPAGQKHYVQLYEHPVKWTYRPYLELVVRGVKFTIDLEVVLTFKIDQAVLVIDGGRVMAIEPGTIKAEGTAKIGTFELCPPIKKELGDLPGSISFGEGLLLQAPPPGRQPAHTPPTP